MTPPPDGTPWWAWLLGLLVAVALPAIAVALIQQGKRVSAIKEQVQNTHETNLRDDVDALSKLVRDGLQAVRDDVGGLHSETRDLRKDVTGIRDDARHDRRELSRQRQALDQHLADVPKIIDDAFAGHIGDCPIRRLATE